MYTLYNSISALCENTPIGSYQVFEELEKLSKNYTFAKLRSFGKSLLGRPLYSFTFGEGDTKILCCAGHHANEWLTSLVLLKTTQDLCRGFYMNSRFQGIKIRELFNRAQFCMIPLVNPDGMDLVTGRLERGPALYNARSMSRCFPNIPFPEGWKANIRGVDLNLQYPAAWQRARTKKYQLGYYRPGPRDYVGPHPFSEPESFALGSLTIKYDPDIVLALHSQGKEIYWCFDHMAPPNAREFGEIMAESSGYTLTSPPPESSSAGYKDWFISEFGRPGYTLELGLGNNPLPVSQLNSMCADFAHMLAALSKKL